MRFIITLITSLILLIHASGQGQWEIVGFGIDSVIIDGYYENNTWMYIDNLTDVQFINRNIGFYSGGWDGGHLRAGILYKTEDGGKTWNLTYNRVGSISSIHFINESVGFIDLNIWGVGCPTFKTVDGGYSWSGDNTIPHCTNCLFFLNDSIGWAGSNGVFKTIDRGENWIFKFNTIGSINSLFFIDDSTGWVVGSEGSIVKYTSSDGWKLIPTVTDLPLKKVFFVDRNIGWIAGGYSNCDDFRPIFIRTMDGGENWTQNTEMNYLINDFYFENKDHGWAVGKFGPHGECGDDLEWGVILETYNSGVDWDVVTDTLPARLNALHFQDGVGWAVGDKGLILTNDSTITGIKEDNKINSGNEPLFQNYPNPFQFTTIISYQLQATGYVELSVYDISGRRVATLVNKTQHPDSYEVEWNAEGMESGIYICELKTGQGRQVMKMIRVGQ